MPSVSDIFYIIIPVVSCFRTRFFDPKLFLLSEVSLSNELFPLRELCSGRVPSYTLVSDVGDLVVISSWSAFVVRHLCEGIPDRSPIGSSKMVGSC